MPAGFNYSIGDNTGVNRFRQFLSMSGSTRTKGGLITFDRDQTGTIVVTGVGFQPKAILLFGVLLPSFNPFENYANMHIGMATATDQWSGGVWSDHLNSLNSSSRWDNTRVMSAIWGVVEDEIDTTLVSFDADGFTINITDDLDPHGAEIFDDTQIAYLAITGDGGFAVGTEQGRTSNGLQAITGLGFQPSAIFFASAHRPTLGSASDFNRLMFGGADANGDYIAWTGAKSGDIYTDNASLSGRCISHMEDADGGGPFQPTPQSEARLDSLDADGFTLDWFDTDGVGRYYSWFAVEEGEVGRWTYNNNLNKPVLTSRKPKGLIFFSSDTGTESLDHNTSTFGATIGLGICDEDMGVQQLASYGIVSAGSFGAQHSVRSVLGGAAFGAYRGQEGGVASTLGNFPRDWGTINELLDARKPQIIRYR